MELVRRKKNRLTSYDYSQNGAYFLTICTQGRRPILSSIYSDNTTPKLTTAGQIVEDLINALPIHHPSITVDHHIIMPDHIHLLIRIENGTGDPSPTIGKAVAWLKYTATKQINITSNTVGQKRFQRSYYDHVIRNEEDYDSRWMYIDNNPISWKIKHGIMYL